LNKNLATHFLKPKR